MVLTRDRATPYKEGLEVAYPVAGTAKIYAGSLVCVNAAGYAVPAADTAGYRFVGVAMEQADNSSGSDGDIYIKVRRDGIFQFAATSIAQASVGDDMYVVDDETFDESDPGNGIKCGKLVAVISSSKGWLAIGRAIATAFAGAADALTVSDSGDFFPAAANTVAEQIQALAGDLIPLFIPRYTGWTKDGTDKQLVGPKFELNFPCRIKRAYMNLGTASTAGGGEVLVVKFGSDTMLEPATGATQAENESLDIAVAANTDFLSAAGGVLLNETAGGLAANLDLVLMVARDDGE